MANAGVEYIGNGCR